MGYIIQFKVEVVLRGGYMEESAKSMNKGFKIFLVILIVGILFFMKVENRDKVQKIIQDITVKEKTLDFNSRIELEDGVESVNNFDNILVKWKSNNLSFIKPDGSIVWEKGYSFVEPYIYYGEKLIYAIDKSNGHIYSMDKNGETVYKVQLNESIFGVSESNGSLIVHIKTPEGENIKILNETGDIVRTHEELENSILYYDLNPDKSSYSVSTIKTSGNKLISQLGIYNLSGEKLEEVNFENTIILRSEFIGEELLVLTDTSVNYIKDGIVKWKRHFPGIKDIYVEEKRVFILYDKNFESIGFDGKTIDKFIFAVDYNKIISMDKSILLYGKNNVVGINEDREIFNYKMDKDILGLYYYQSSIYIHNSGEVEIFKIKTK